MLVMSVANIIFLIEVIFLNVSDERTTTIHPSGRHPFFSWGTTSHFLHVNKKSFLIVTQLNIHKLQLNLKKYKQQFFQANLLGKKK